MEAHRKRQFRFSSTYLLIAVLMLFLVQRLVAPQVQPRQVPYSEFLTDLKAGRVVEVQLRASGIVAELKPQPGQKPEIITTDRLPGIDESPLLTEMQARGVTFSGDEQRGSAWGALLVSWLLPIALMGLFFVVGLRRMGKSSGPLSFGKNRAQIYDSSQQAGVTFEDVAGVDEAEAELIEIVEFLKHPEKYRALGAQIPRGVLLVGPPGTGKTLLARAVAGEAAVPFFSMTGSSFVEMFVGVGAARVRDLFEQAKLRAPCIIFIDELDAIGRSRGGLGTLASNDEREQTLNQLLAEMDGFDPTTGVIIMAATNRPEVLDAALLRAGRFDRQVLVDRPDVKGREEILEVHARKIRLAQSVSLKLIAQRTPGMVGADLANVVNEAALSAGRRAAQGVEQQDFEEAIDRIQLGLKKRGRVMSQDEKKRVAFHEAGHTLVGLSVEHADPVHRVTIIPRSIGALGATLQLPTSEHYLLTESQLRDHLCVMLGGRTAEELCLGETSTGAENDLERATEMSRRMVTRFGMSERLGPLTWGRQTGLQFLEIPFGSGEEKNFSEETARNIDEALRGIVEKERTRAMEILTRRRPVLERIARRLLEVETLERADLEAIIRDTEAPAVEVAPVAGALA